MISQGQRPIALSLKGTQLVAGGNAPGKAKVLAPDPERVEFH